jgi:hypothetical protein
MSMPSELLKGLVSIYRGENIRYPHLREVTLAQWLLESARATLNRRIVMNKLAIAIVEYMIEMNG